MTTAIDRLRLAAVQMGLAVVFAAALVAAPAAAREAPASFADLAEKLSPSVVNISTVQTVRGRALQQQPFPPGSPFEEFFEEFFGRRGPGGEAPERRMQSLGSGFIIDSGGLIVTNNHVIEAADEITVITVDGEEFEATVIGRDAEADIALLKVEADRSLPAVEWGESDPDRPGSRVGDWVMTIGNPFGLGGTVTAGIISAHHRQISQGPYEDFLQTDASINRGNSGGPLFDMSGKVIGVNTAIFSPTGGNIGIGFAIPSNQARRIVAQLQEFGYARRGFLGVNIQTVDEMTAEALGLEEARGAIVTQVVPGGPADKAGVQPGDIIVSFAGKKVEDNRELQNVVAEVGVEETVKMAVLRDGEKKTLSVTTGERPRPEQEAEAPAAPSEPGLLGMELANLNTMLRQEFDIPAEVNGAVIVNVSRELARRGLRRGDVITEVNRTSVSSVTDVRNEIAAAREGGKKAALLRIYREGDYFYVPLELSQDEEEQ